MSKYYNLLPSVRWRRVVSACILLTGMSLFSVAQAEVVIVHSGTYDGANSTEADSEAGNWLDKTVAKTFDGDGDNRLWFLWILTGRCNRQLEYFLDGRCSLSLVLWT